MTVSSMMRFLLQKWWPEQTMYDRQLRTYVAFNFVYSIYLTTGKQLMLLRECLPPAVHVVVWE